MAEPADDGEKTFPRMGMTGEEFRSAAKDMVDYVIKYYETLKDRQPLPSVEPGFMRDILRSTAPETAEPWKKLFADLDEVVMKGLTHWQSSRFFAYFPTATSYPSMLADILCDACASIGFTWVSSPSCTELETVTLDWLAKCIGLPECFIHDGKGPGSGVIHGTASEATIMCLLAARTKALELLSPNYPGLSKHELSSKFVAYTSECSHSSVERACLIGMIDLRRLPVDDDVSVRGDTLKNAVEEDKANGKIPLFMCATLGTTVCASFDNLFEIGQVCSSEGIWLHIDAAYAGSSFICPEFRHHLKGVEMANSFNFNPHKWLMVNFDLSALWVKDSADLINSFKVNPLYLQHDAGEKAIDYRHWQIPLGRRFRSLKLWFVLRLYGVEGLRHRIRKDITLAKLFETFVKADERFEVVFPVELGLICFRLRKDKHEPQKNRKLNERLLSRINNSRDIYIVPGEVKEIYFLRVATGAVACDKEAVQNCWKVIQKHTSALLAEDHLPK